MTLIENIHWEFSTISYYDSHIITFTETVLTLKIVILFVFRNKIITRFKEHVTFYHLSNVFQMAQNCWLLNDLLLRFIGPHIYVILITIFFFTPKFVIKIYIYLIWNLPFYLIKSHIPPCSYRFDCLNCLNFI